LPSARRGSGIKGASTTHCSSVSSIRLFYTRRALAPVFEMTSS
jgi:hypothetical protein